MGGTYLVPGSSVRITTATTTTIRASGRTILQRIVIGTTTAFTVSIQNGDGTVVALLKASMPEGVYEFGIYCNGLKVVTGGASDITVVYL